jgi:hypothetical protein
MSRAFWVTDAKREQLDRLIGEVPSGPRVGVADPVSVAGYNMNGIVTAGDQFLGPGRKRFRYVGFSSFDSAAGVASPNDGYDVWLAGPSVAPDPTFYPYPKLVVGCNTPANSLDGGRTDTAGVFAKDYYFGPKYNDTLARSDTLPEAFAHWYVQATGGAGDSYCTGVVLDARMGSGHSPITLMSFVPTGGGVASACLVSELAAVNVSATNAVSALTVTADKIDGGSVTYGGGVYAGGVYPNPAPGVSGGPYYVYSGPTGWIGGATATYFGMQFVGGILVTGSTATLTAGGGSATPIAGAGTGNVLYSDGSAMQSTSLANISGGRFQIDAGTDRQISLGVASY